MPIVDRAAKRPLWQWIAFYLVLVAILVYGIMNYSVLLNNGTQTATQSAQVVTDHTVTYTNSGFSPKVLTTTRGSTITFVNASSDAINVASDPHPIHDLYPTTGGCISSTFDSCDNIPPGQSWSFTFDVLGTWEYHNHRNPGKRGTIVVQ